MGLAAQTKVWVGLPSCCGLALEENLFLTFFQFLQVSTFLGPWPYPPPSCCCEKAS